MAASWWPWRRPAEVQRAPGPGRAGTGEPATIYARALLKRAEITEQYFTEQEISMNSERKPGGRPFGRIELVMPYDGYRYFTRAAKGDVDRQATAYSQHRDTAVVGHLLLKGYSATDLRQRLDLAGDLYGPIAIEVPVRDGELDHLHQFSADQQTGMTVYDFEPDDPVVMPAGLDIELFDPDSLDLLPADLSSFDLETDRARRDVSDAIAEIARHVGFREELFLRIVVHLSLPVHADAGRPRPRVARVAIKWPTITSMETLKLRVGDARPGRRVSELTEMPIRYNPVEGCIEWADVPMYDVAELANLDEEADQPEDEAEAAENGEAEQVADAADSAADEAGEPGEDEDSDENHGRMRHYQSAVMLLSIGHPGELYKQPTLEAVADLEVSGYLMSGMAARLYDANGYYRKSPLKLTTKICASAELRLDDAFARRDRSPSQDLFFDEIIPDEMRIADIKTALEDRGFAVRKVWPQHDGPHHDKDENTVSWLHVAHRKVGPDDMVLWTLAVGQRRRTRRETIMHGGGITHSTSLPSGELRVVVRGSLPGDSEGRLTHEMNMLHEALRERYGRARQRR